MINIREIYSFYYQDNLYSKAGDLVFFDLFDLDILFDSLGRRFSIQNRWPVKLMIRTFYF